jgi:PKD repeat protein
LSDSAVFDEQVFSWTPQQPGIYQVTFIVSDYKSLVFVTVQMIVEAK